MQIDDTIAITYENYINNFNRRNSLKIKNLHPSSQPSPNKSSQIKLIQKFIGKLKIDNKNYQSILNQMEGLNLAKYLEEISNIILSSINHRQISFYSEIATNLNITYEQFANILIEDSLKYFNLAIETSEDNRTKIKTLLMFITELYSIGFPFSYKTIIQLLKKVFKAGNKKKTILNTQVQRNLFAFYYNSDSFAVFLVNHSETFTRRVPKWVEEWVQEGKQINKLSESVPLKSRQDLTIFFTKYIKQCHNILLETIKKIKQYEDILRDNLKLQGQFNKETQKRYNEIISKYIFTKKNMRIIADAINQQYQPINYQNITTEELLNQYINKVQNVNIFEDQFQRGIYQNLIPFPSTEQKTAKQEEYQLISEKLNKCKNITDADEIANEFIKINNKKMRKMLAKDALEYRKEYQLITPYLCRVVATINQSYKDIGDFVSQILVNEYDKLKDCTVSTFVTNDKKSRNLRYICQFTKFNVLDPDRVMLYIKNLIDDLKGFNIELLISVLESVGRFLYLSPTSANKFTFLLSQLQNVINAKSLPIFITSQLQNSISLLKPHKQIPTNLPKQLSQLEIKINSIFNHSIIDDIQVIMQQINKAISTPQGLSLLQAKLIDQIQRYQYLGTYNYAYMLNQLNNQPIIDFVSKSTVERLINCVENGQCQRSLLWGRFIGELYKYELMKKSILYSVMERLLKIKGNDLIVIKSICTILKTCEGYLKTKKISIINQQFKILINLKKLINETIYLPMLQQFDILEVYEEYEPYLAFLNKQQIQGFQSYITKQSTEEINLSEELRTWVTINQIKVPNKKESQPMVDTRQDRKEEIEIKDKLESPSIQQIKSFQQEYTNIIDMNIREYSSRIAKPIIQEKYLQKKKDKKIKKTQSETEKQKVITVIGRTGGKYVKKEPQRMMAINNLWSIIKEDHSDPLKQLSIQSYIYTLSQYNCIS